MDLYYPWYNSKTSGSNFDLDTSTFSKKSSAQFTRKKGDVH